ncbi:hypothetical protein ACNF49_41130 [Actinomadura sp. ATCC 39365]
MLTRLTRIGAITALLGIVAALGVASPASADISFADCNDYGGVAVPRQTRAIVGWNDWEGNTGPIWGTSTEYWCEGGNNGGQKIAWRS